MALSTDAFQHFRDLIQRLRDGSEEAARELVELHEDAIRRAIRRTLDPRLRPILDSTDFLQMVWRSFFRCRGDALRFRKPEELAAFLIGMARKKVASEARERLVRQRHNLNRECYLEDLIEQGRGIPDGQAAVVESLIQAEEWGRFLSRLSGQDRQIVELWSKGLSNPEIAKELGIAEATVWRVLRKLLPDELSVAWLRPSRSKRPGPTAGVAK